ncbi:MMPL family transporter [Paenibacillus xylanilyticus]|uniref:MMPL family transporter n=1 Tax=Paenibacillus xylanilyticus TaxID=248903 RepID=A0A7Y6BXU5_9BACL|nr:MMPL family transporter [Paenibacillus xylanilyticus]NUU76578.1 MMPL family transporter [Paenibacillus xylanilyticus]
MGYRSLAFLIGRYPRFIMISWVLIIGMSAVWAWKLPGIVQDHGLKRIHGDAHHVEAILKEDFGIPDDPVIVVYEKKTGTSSAEFRKWIGRHLQQIRTLPDMATIISPLEAGGSAMMRDDTAYALLDFDVPAHRMDVPIERLRSLVAADDAGFIRLTGKPVVQEDVNHLSFRDLERAEMVGLPIALLILCFAFRGLHAALIAVIMGIVGVVTAMGVTSLMGYYVELSNFVINVIPMVGMALSIDFALIILSRYREEMQRDQHHKAPDPYEILQRTLRTAGRAVLFSAACVLLGLLSLVWIRLPMFLSVSLGAMTVLVISVLLNVTLLPAILSLYAHRIFKRKKQYSFSAPQRKRSFWHRWFGTVMKQPVRMTMLGTGILLFCVLPVRQLEMAIPDATSLPARIESRQAAEDLKMVFGQKDVSSVDILIGGTGKQLTAAHWNTALQKVRDLLKDEDVLQIESVWGIQQKDRPGIGRTIRGTSTGRETNLQNSLLPLYVSEDTIRMVATIQGAPGSGQAADWLKRMKDRDAEQSDIEIPIRYGGEAAAQHEIIQEILGQLPKVMVFVIVSNYMVLLAAFRSLLIPIKAILMNLLSLTASFGALVLVFNQGHLGMEPAAIAIMIPVFIAGLVFGISMDYGVFMLSRIQEVYRRTGDSDQAVMQGLASTGRLITSAAAILLAVTVPFAFGDVEGVKQLGVGITAAVFIDVTVIRLLLVPALMKLMGKWNWWLPGQKT